MAHAYIKKDKTTGKFNLIESEFEQILAIHETYESARKQAKFVNNGGAFAGFTPPFILRKVKTK